MGTWIKNVNYRLNDKIICFWYNYYEKGVNYPQADTMFALIELYGASLYDITRNHEDDEKPSSAIFGEYVAE